MSPAKARSPYEQPNLGPMHPYTHLVWIPYALHISAFFGPPRLYQPRRSTRHGAGGCGNMGLRSQEGVSWLLNVLARSLALCIFYFLPLSLSLSLSFLFLSSFFCLSLSLSFLFLSSFFLSLSLARSFPLKLPSTSKL